MKIKKLLQKLQKIMDIEIETKLKHLENEINNYTIATQRPKLDSYDTRTLYHAAKHALAIFIDLAELNNLNLKPVLIESLKTKSEKLKSVYESLLPKPVIPEFGEFGITNSRGTVVFIDITKSSDYFKEAKNYTGFVIFNSFIMLVNTITRLNGGEFIEHTGDGAMLFFKEKDFIREFDLCRKQKCNLADLSCKHILCLYLYIGESIKRHAINHGLIEVKNENYSLAHIGAAYGEVLIVHLDNFEKLISKAVWDAANNCKKAPREVDSVPVIATYADES